MLMRVKLLCLLLVVMLMNLTVTFAQEVTPAAEATTASETADTAVETTPPAAEETEVSEAEVRGLPLGVLLLGAVAVLSIGTIVLVRENPRPLDEEV